MVPSRSAQSSARNPITTGGPVLLTDQHDLVARSYDLPTSPTGPQSTISWSIVTTPTIGRRRPPMSTSPPVDDNRRGTPSAYPIGTVATVVSRSNVWRSP